MAAPDKKTSEEPTKVKAPHRGRPTKNRDGKDATRESIISIAISLFSRKGYARTSLSEIARNLQMDTSSLYYYFSSKAALLESIIEGRAYVPSIEEMERLTPSRAAQLYALIVHNVEHKCKLPFDFLELEDIANEVPEKFTAFFESYRRFYLLLVDEIAKGVEEGEFIACEPDERAVVILSTSEGLQHHYHAKIRGKLILEKSGYTVRDHTPEAIGHLTAQAVMPSLMTSPLDFEQAAEEGHRVFHELKEQ